MQLGNADISDDVFANAIARAFDPKRLELTILPTEKCQFRCSYCYEDFAIGTMKPAIVRGVKSLIARRVGDLDALDISWFGGEPLLAISVIRDIMSFAKRECEQTGTQLTSSMTTNGHLLNLSQFIELLDLKVQHFQITLDGPQEIHDQIRKLNGGGPTFNQIWNNLLQIKRTGRTFEVLLRLHISPDNKHNIVEFSGDLCREFLANDQRFDILPMTVGDWGGPNSGKFKTLTTNEGNELELAIRAAATPYRAHPEEAHEDSRHLDVCYASKPNFLMIRADGTVGKCTVALNNSKNKLGSINEDGTLCIEQSKLSLWHKGWESGKSHLLACPFHSYLEFS